mmetsp:Transcript_33013/g.70242  ORF Transcript_33013/g.70242 Transcript_33013/m.70242 type:complete len:216 (+) Transcript_33013:1446-2093(+)
MAPESPIPFQATSTSARRPPSREFLRIPLKREAAPPPERKLQCKDKRMRCLCSAASFPSATPSWIALWFSSKRSNAGHASKPLTRGPMASLLNSFTERSNLRSCGNRPWHMGAESASAPFLAISFRDRSRTSVCSCSPSRSAAARAFTPLQVRRTSRKRQRRISPRGKSSGSLSKASSWASPSPCPPRSSSSPRRPSRAARANLARMPRSRQASS